MSIMLMAVGFSLQFPSTMLTAIATAQDSISTQELLACKEIRDDPQRLACLDLLLSDIGELTVVDGQSTVRPNTQDNSGPTSPPTVAAVTRTEEQDFGLSTSQLKPKDAASEISGAVKEILLTKSGRYVIRLENGQEWRQLKSNSKKLLFKGDGNGLNVTIKEKLLGSFALTIEGSKRSIRVNRKK